MGILDGLMQAQSSGKDTVKKVGIGGFSMFARVSDATEYPSQVPVDVLEDGSNASDDIINGPLTKKNQRCCCRYFCRCETKLFF
ncbi:hypothetical protein MP879_07185 [Escherichia coli]|uniref:hypothetical protein n=1 Tax=Escherichia coli TaxID=562 RepID=UPI00224599C5|nr:hypothetical protein [Escherichia coli]MCX0007971.1 hypothetical protein [Escherichia coli]